MVYEIYFRKVPPESGIERPAYAFGPGGSFDLSVEMKILSESSEASALALFVNGLGIDSPHAAAMGGDHYDIVPRVDDQVMDIAGGQTATQHVPGFSAIFGDINPDVCPYVQDVLVYRIFPDHIDRTERDVSGDVFPSLSEIRGFPHISAEIIIPLTILGHVNRPQIIGRGNHPGHPFFEGQSLHDLFPGFASIPGDVDVPIVGSHIDQAEHQRGFGDGKESLEGDIA